MDRSYLKYLLCGILFVGTQEFWVSFIWGRNLASFILAVAIIEVLFLTFTYLVGKLIDKFFSRSGVADIIVYLISGMIGLIAIEWIFIGNLPGRSEANQLVMFTTWGGAALFARISTDNSPSLEKIKKYTMRFFLAFAGVATVLGLLFLSVSPTPEAHTPANLSFIITYYAAIFGYPLMNIFYAWFFAKKLKGTRR